MDFFRACIAGILVSTASPAFAVSCTDAERDHADAGAQLNAADTAAAIKGNLPWDAPKAAAADNIQLLASPEFVLAYDSNLRVPIWTAHELVSSGLGKVSRVDCFRRDPRLSSAIASTPADYDEPIYDQGHLVNSADMTMSMDAQLHSFWMSNMAPETCWFNRGVWQILEGIVRLWAADSESGTVYVITGTVFDRDGDHVRDPDDKALRMKSRNGRARVAVPSHVYDIVLRKSGSSVESIAILMPNDNTDLDGDDALKYIGAHIVSIAEIERITGLSFFDGTSLASKKAGVTKVLWPIHGKKPKALTKLCK